MCSANKQFPSLSWQRCRGLVKPDIVFFGEPLPERFVWHVPHDFPRVRSRPA